MRTCEPSLKILVVDDNPDDSELYLRILSRDPHKQYDVSNVELGQQGLERYPELQPDCILLDYNLPDMNGIEFMRRLTEDFDVQSIPVVMLTGQGSEVVAVEAMKNGARDYLVKGKLTSEALLRAVGNVIDKVVLERRNSKLTQQLRTANDDLKRKNKKLNELTQTAHRFVDNVAHDFRTPLTVIKEFSSIIADGLGGPVTDQQAEYLQFIVTATRDLAQMVDDFLDSSKLKARMLRVDRKPGHISDILQSVRSMLASRAASKHIQLVEQIPSDLPEVFADLEKIGRVIVNLAVNAIKFSREHSQIVVWADAQSDTDLRIGVTDQGPGLTEEDMAIIFERFKQVGDIQRASTKGFGLGLNIAKELVWLNLGTVQVQSQWGKGSVFSFTLPRHDRDTILRRYFDRLAELNDPPSHIAALQVSAAGSTGDLEPVRRFLSSTCYPMDVVIPITQRGFVLAIGSTLEPERWIKRLEAAWDQSQRGRGTPRPHMRCGAWFTYEEIKNQGVAAMLSHVIEPSSVAAL